MFGSGEFRVRATLAALSNLKRVNSVRDTTSVNSAEPLGLVLLNGTVKSRSVPSLTFQLHQLHAAGSGAEGTGTNVWYTVSS